MNAKKNLKIQRGQGLVEYALTIAVVALVAFVAVGLIGWGSKLRIRDCRRRVRSQEK